MDMKAHISELYDAVRSYCPPAGSPFWTRIAPRVILAVFAAVCFVTSLVNPLGEGYDEWAHFAYIRYVVTERELPSSGQRLVPEIDWDATHHPPLYYLIGAAATSWIDMTDNLRPIVNPHMSSGRSLNAYIHTAAEDWPYRGSVLGMHVARSVSTIMGLMTLWLTHRIARLLIPGRPDLAAAAMATTAFIPQFAFTHSIVTNDAAVTMFCTLALYCMVRLFARPTAWAGLGTWLAIAAAFMSKANGVALIPAGVVVTGWALWRVRARLRTRDALGFVALTIASVAGVLLLLYGWEEWNAYLRGQPSSVTGALRRYIIPALAGGSEGSRLLYDWRILPAGLLYMWRTFWAAFGLGNVPVGEGFYWAVTVFTLAGIVGAARAWHLANRSERWRAKVPALTALLLLIPPVFLIPVSRLPFVSPGRYLMPAAPILGMALAVGLARVLPGRVRPVVSWVFAGGVLCISMMVPWLYIRPAYAQARVVSVDYVNANATPFQAQFGEGMELVGYRVDYAAREPGDIMSVSLFWRCLAEIPVDYTVSVQALDPSFRFYGGTENYPGRGSYPTSLWRPGEIIEDRHSFTVGQDLNVPTFVQLKVDVYRLETGEFLPVTPASQIGGTAAVFGRTPVRAASRDVWRPSEVTATFGGSIELAQAGFGEPAIPGSAVEITLTWRCLAPMGQNYTVFLHLLDADGVALAQSDGPPLAGRYPTNLWSAGEQIVDRRAITLPDGVTPGEYRVALGWYLLETLDRLPAVGASGLVLDANQVLVPIEITASDLGR
jgi:4-amino-4-deoxy-L-arabinose transferase-like glycosyltransferase